VGGVIGGGVARAGGAVAAQYLGSRGEKGNEMAVAGVGEQAAHKSQIVGWNMEGELGWGSLCPIGQPCYAAQANTAAMAEGARHRQAHGGGVAIRQNRGPCVQM
jgi:hypothetical protein